MTARATSPQPARTPAPKRPVRQWRLAEALALLSILLIAAGLRLGWPGTVEFMQDEANFSRFALDLVHGVEFPLLSIDSSVGIRNPPMTVYIMALPYAFTSNPLIATAFVGVLGVLAVLAFYLLLRVRHGLLVAAIGGALFATSPWLVMYSRKIWDLLPLPLTLFMLTGFVGFARDFGPARVEPGTKRRFPRWVRLAQLLHLPLLSMIGQIHYATVALILFTLFLILPARRRLTWAFWLSIPLAIAIAVPFLIGAAREGYLTPAILDRVRSNGAPTVSITEQAQKTFQTAALMLAGTESFSPPGQQQFSDTALTPPDTLFGQAFYIIFGVVTFFAAIWMLMRLIGRVRRGDGRAVADGALLIGLFGTPLLFAFPWTRLYTHYLLPCLPFGFAVISVTIGDLWNGLARVPRLRSLEFAPIGAALIALFTFQAISFAAHIEYVARRATPGVFSTPLGAYMPARAAILDQRPQAVLASVEGQYVGYHTEASIWNVLLYDIPLRRFADDSIEVYPAVPTPFLSHRCTEPVPLNQQNFYLRPGEPCLNVQLRSKADYPAAQFRPIAGGMKLENGIAPVAYRWVTAPRACLSVAWEPQGSVPEDWQAKAHLIDAGGQVVAFADSEFWRGRYWRAGDTIVKTGCVADGTDPAKIASITGAEIGLYLKRGDQFQNLNFVDGAGQAAGPSIRLDLTTP